MKCQCAVPIFICSAPRYSKRYRAIQFSIQPHFTSATKYRAYTEQVVAVQGDLSVFEVEVLDEVGVDPADLGHEVEGLVEVLLPQALVLDEIQEVGALDVALQPNHTCDEFHLPFTLLYT